MRLSFREVLGLTILISAVLYFINGPGISELTKKENKTTQEYQPDIATLIQTTITSTQKQNQLLVQTIKMNATASTTAKEMGMEAWQIVIAGGEAQYLVDLKQLDSKRITINKNDIVITLPKTALIVRQLPYVLIDTKDNNSWLFTWRSQLRSTLSKHNAVKITKSFMEQAQERKEDAYVQARYALETSFNIPFKVAGLQHHVSVSFQ